MAPMACAAPDARTTPPAPDAIAGMAGMDPAVMRMALMILIALGCSDVMYSRAVAAFNNHAGASALVVTTDGEVSTTILEPPNKGMAYLRHCLHETVLVTVSSIRCASSTSRS